MKDPATAKTLTTKGCVAMPLLQQNKECTTDDIYALPDGQRAELIDGQMYMMAPPTRRHQQILGALYRKIADYIDKKGCTGAPDWILEIVSPGSRRMDYYTKLFKYRTAGVREYWIVDPEKSRITVYSFESDDTAEYTFSEAVKPGIYDDLEIDFSSIDI